MRFDGQQLNIANLNPVFRFNDVRPFDHLSSIFMISFSKELNNPQEIIQICSKTKIGTDENAAPSKRGIKGGFAVGGYNKK